MKPEQALEAARAAAAKRDDTLPASTRIEPTERVSIEQLMEWANIEPDVDLMRSTRKLGAPITWAKRQLIHVLRQYLRELQSQQTRFNLNVLIRVAELEDRVARLEERADRHRQSVERPPGPQRRGAVRRRDDAGARVPRPFRAWGWGGRDVAAEIDPRIGSRIASLRSLDARDGDVLLVHYSAYAPKLRGVLEMPQRKLLISHNITPARWFWDHDPQAGVVCALGRKQLPQFAAAADVAAGVSLYNAQEFGSDVVIPILFDPAGLGAPRRRGSMRRPGRLPTRRRSSSSGAWRRTSARTPSSGRSSCTAAATPLTRGSCSSARRSTGPTTPPCERSPRRSRRAA